jgi:hypothetical protein
MVFVSLACPCGVHVVQIIPRVVKVRWVRYLLLVAFAALAGVSFYCFMHLEQGLMLEHLVKDDSYFHTFAKVRLLAMK